jgi:hypothetical protein
MAEYPNQYWHCRVKKVHQKQDVSIPGHIEKASQDHTMKKVRLLVLLSAVLLLRHSALAAEPDFGPNVIVLDPATADAQGKVDAVYKTQERNQFGTQRYCILLKPGKYNLSLMVGFYTQVAGLGQSPDDVSITGTLEANAGWFRGNATQNFWRSAENLCVTPTGGGRGGAQIKWAVSQGVAFRHIHVKGGMSLFDGGWSSGGFLADCKIDGNVTSGSQQQWFSRNDDWGGWNGGNWNMVFLGVTRPPAGDWPRRPYTVVDKTPVIREKPYLALASGQYVVMVPDLQTNVAGTSWAQKGKAIPLSAFYIAHDKDNAATLNAALAQGKHLVLTPGIYRLEDSLKVTKADTIVMGMGYATLIPEQGTPAITVADVDGVKVCGVLLESGKKLSPTLLQVGTPGSTLSHAANPIFLYDIFTRTGGMGPGQASCFVTINSNNVVCDNFWLWRGDHGPGAGWNSNPCKNGLIVNGNDVTCYGLAVEHTQEYQVLWNGEGGRTYFYQSEFPYDPPGQQAWAAPGGARGFASYKVADKVKTHEAWGVGVYAFFRGGIIVDSAIQAPDAPGIKMHHLLTFGGRGSVIHVINDRSGSGGNPSRLE